MSLLDIEEILEATEKLTTPSITSLTYNKVQKYKNDVLQRAGLSRDKLKSYNKKLKEYRYCDDISDIQDGRFIRWISLKDPENVTLRNGAFVSDILILNNGLHIQCKNRGRVFQIKYDECEIFQKLTREEHILLSVLSNLEK
ncbi:MAG: hypothetical protein CXT73_04025 [Methanobacteriota archaeon]|nr:MAG: hypothetical protein CXT73_04025 [Euryarchaeota archaeon]